MIQNASQKLKYFRDVFCNVIIAVAVLFVLGLSIKDDIAQVFKSGGPQAYYNGDTSKNNISLMINVYWGTEYIDDMLLIFDQYNVKCTFFIGGSWAAKNEEVLKEIARRGHEIGNHGYFHKDHKNLSREQNREEIYVTQKLIESICGVKTTLFAPPSGSYSKVTLEVAEELGYKTIMWTKDTIDWRDKNTDLIYKRATTKASNGDLILMHPTQNTVEALPKIIKMLKEKGFSLVTVSENIATASKI
ncbi:MAG TPA: polysaccharide deacetylase family protein [Clostridia bacterium]